MTFDTYKSNTVAAIGTSGAAGAISYVVGSGISNLIKYSFPVILPNAMNSTCGQQAVISGMQAVGEAFSNSSLVNSILFAK